MNLPEFPYHPDPIATGSIIASSDVCLCCGQKRGFIYDGPVYSAEEYDRDICAWCISDGTAHSKLNASFTDEAGIGGGGWDLVTDAVIEEVANRTPGFSGWQQERWWTHCGDAAQFLGRAGRKELEELRDDPVIAVLRIDDFDPDLDDDEWIRNLDKDGSPTAYLFRCRHCQALGGYWDCD